MVTFLHSFIISVFHYSWIYVFSSSKCFFFFLKRLSGGGFLKAKLVDNLLHFARLHEKRQIGDLLLHFKAHGHCALYVNIKMIR